MVSHYRQIETNRPEKQLLDRDERITPCHYVVRILMIKYSTVFLIRTF